MIITFQWSWPMLMMLRVHCFYFLLFYLFVLPFITTLSAIKSSKTSQFSLILVLDTFNNSSFHIYDDGYFKVLFKRSNRVFLERKTHTKFNKHKILKDLHKEKWSNYNFILKENLAYWLLWNKCSFLLFFLIVSSFQSWVSAYVVWLPCQRT